MHQGGACSGSGPHDVRRYRRIWASPASMFQGPAGLNPRSAGGGTRAGAPPLANRPLSATGTCADRTGGRLGVPPTSASRPHRPTPWFPSRAVRAPSPLMQIDITRLMETVRMAHDCSNVCLRDRPKILEPTRACASRALPRPRILRLCLPPDETRPSLERCLSANRT